MTVALALAAALAALPSAAAPSAAAPAAVDHSADADCPHADEQPTSPDALAGARTTLLCLLNADRRAHRRRPLHANAHLHRAAQAYAAALDPNGPLVHVGHDGSTPRSRIRGAGFAKRFLYAEVLGRSVGRTATPAARSKSWLANASARAVLRSARFREIGIGITLAGDKATFVVVVATKAPRPRHRSSTRTASARAKRSSGSSRRAPKSSRS